MDNPLEKKRNLVGFIEIFIIAAVVLLARILFEFDAPKVFSEGGVTFSAVLLKFLNNYSLVILAVLLDLILIYVITRNLSYGVAPVKRTLMEFGGIAIISIIIAFLQRIMMMNKPFALDVYMLMSLIVAFFINTICVTLADLICYNRWKNRQALDLAVKMRSQANYKYQLLKNQLNPHFLFNSLNVLDYLIHTDQNRASDYVKKMANVYRYLLAMDDRTTATLEEEMEFVKQYVDMMHERFASGFDVDIDVDRYYYHYKVVPCSVQTLIENAVKHNVVSEKNPLPISVSVKDDYLVVSNPLHPKIESSGKSGKGLDNINEQYRILFNADIIVEKGDADFTVRLPLFR
ncbi:MAG: histidine kinase [Bacteroidales bacterium]|jgi:hypothetical protein|nr:histidine kinase [Bacteroidales bacterium]MCI2121338.1 histidine kinase [Bacteroidales bacterium]MCI2145911.1 histidine kinase [Bacteroidales bacterium]